MSMYLYKTEKVKVTDLSRHVQHLKAVIPVVNLRNIC
jgi:hypothetical protein